MGINIGAILGLLATAGWLAIANTLNWSLGIILVILAFGGTLTGFLHARYAR